MGFQVIGDASWKGVKNRTATMDLLMLYTLSWCLKGLRFLLCTISEDSVTFGMHSALFHCPAGLGGGEEKVNNVSPSLNSGLLAFTHIRPGHSTGHLDTL